MQRLLKTITPGNEVSLYSVNVLSVPFLCERF